jgi:hypothetical protein
VLLLLAALVEVAVNVSMLSAETGTFWPAAVVALLVLPVTVAVVATCTYQRQRARLPALVWAIPGRYGTWPVRRAIEPRRSTSDINRLLEYRAGHREPLEQHILQCHSR